jgi:hypothetical protein
MAQIEILTAIDLDQMHNSPSLFDPSKDAHINYRLAWTDMFMYRSWLHD